MSKHLQVALDIAQSLEKVGGIDAITLREVKALCLPPARTFTPEQIRGIRQATRTSRAAFAALLNVGASTVEHWETGRKRPSGPAVKLLDLVDRKGLEALYP